MKPAPMFLDRNFKRLAKVSSYLPPFGFKTQGKKGSPVKRPASSGSSGRAEKVSLKVRGSFDLPRDLETFTSVMCGSLTSSSLAKYLMSE